MLSLQYRGYLLRMYENGWANEPREAFSSSHELRIELNFNLNGTRMDMLAHDWQTCFEALNIHDCTSKA